MIYGVDITLKP